MMKQKLNLGKKEGTFGINNSFWIKKFKNGVKLRKRGEGEITLEVYEVFEMLSYLRKFCKRDGCSILLNIIDLTYVWQQYPETQEFIERLLMDKVSDKEKEDIYKAYKTKVNILKELEDKKVIK